MPEPKYTEELYLKAVAKRKDPRWDQMTPDRKRKIIDIIRSVEGPLAGEGAFEGTGTIENPSPFMEPPGVMEQVGRGVMSFGKRAGTNIIQGIAAAPMIAKTAWDEMTVPPPPLPEKPGVKDVAGTGFDLMMSSNPVTAAGYGMAKQLAPGFKDTLTKLTDLPGEKDMGTGEKMVRGAGLLASPILGPDTPDNLMALGDAETRPEAAGTLLADLGQFATPGPKTALGKAYNMTAGAPYRMASKVGEGVTRGLMGVAAKQIKTPHGREVTVPDYRHRQYLMSELERAKARGNAQEIADIEAQLKETGGLVGSLLRGIGEAAEKRLQSRPTTSAFIKARQEAGQKVLTEELRDTLGYDSVTPEELGTKALNEAIQRYDSGRHSLGKRFDEFEKDLPTGEFRKIQVPPDVVDSILTYLEGKRETFPHEPRGGALDSAIQRHLMETDADGNLVPKSDVTLLDVRALAKELRGMVPSGRRIPETGPAATNAAGVFKLLSAINEVIDDGLKKSADPNLAAEWSGLKAEYQTLMNDYHRRVAARVEPLTYRTPGESAVPGVDPTYGARGGGQAFVEDFSDPKTSNVGRQAFSGVLDPAVQEQLMKRHLRTKLEQEALVGPSTPLTKPRDATSQGAIADADFWHGNRFAEIVNKFDENNTWGSIMNPDTIKEIREISRLVEAVEPEKAATLNQTLLPVGGIKSINPASMRGTAAHTFLSLAPDTIFTWLITSPKGLQYTRRAYELARSGNMKLARAAMTAAAKQIQYEMNREQALLGEAGMEESENAAAPVQ